MRGPCCAQGLEFARDLHCDGEEVVSGGLLCTECGKEFPILRGVALLVPDVEGYLVEHVKGVSRTVPDAEIPKRYRGSFKQARAELGTEHIEEDLEAERVNALYLATHYLRAEGGDWWRAEGSAKGSLVDDMVRAHWDRGPFSEIAQWSKEIAGEVVELGCGVGGLLSVLEQGAKSYLGVDSSFASIVWARRLALGIGGDRSFQIPGDLLAGVTSREVSLPSLPVRTRNADFVVGDVTAPPLARGEWDATLALNLMDMLDDPAALPALQNDLLRAGGVAVQSCPYIWHAAVAAGLRSVVPAGVRDSAAAVRWLYERAGFSIEREADQVPWLFFKHARQLEIYLTHLFLARKY